MENDTETKTRSKRSENLIAYFPNGYAENWFMAVGEQFKSELDIKKTNRKIKGEKIEVWTQGTTYAFKEGQVFYDTPEGYTLWSNALKKIIFTCKILKAETKIIATKHRDAYEGFVEFEIYKTNAEKTNIIKIDKYNITQDDFVTFLKAGKIGNREVNSVYG